MVKFLRYKHEISTHTDPLKYVEIFCNRHWLERLAREIYLYRFQYYSARSVNLNPSLEYMCIHIYICVEASVWKDVAIQISSDGFESCSSQSARTHRSSLHRNMFQRLRTTLEATLAAIPRTRSRSRFVFILSCYKPPLSLSSPSLSPHPPYRLPSSKTP